MKLNLKKCILAGMCASLVAVTMAGCKGIGGNKPTAASVQTILIGHHYQPEDDPYWVDEITGEYGMSEDNRRAAIAALNAVKENMGVDIQWVSYPNNIKQCILQTVLAGDPLCHIPIMANGSQGTLLSQNVLQQLDPYVDIFENNPDYNWVLLDKCFGHYYLMNRDLLYMNNWPLVYNATYIEAVPALQVDGKTQYPATLYEEGKWNWSEFRDYLSKIKAYYVGKGIKAASGNQIYPFHTNYTYTLMQAFHSNGACLYDGKEYTYDTKEGIEAAMYLDGLISDELCNVLAAGPNTSTAGYMAPTNAFLAGESVFNNAARWMMDNCGSALAERGQSMGVIPFPWPDDVNIENPYTDYDDPAKNKPDELGNYRIYSSVADSVGLLKGFGTEESRIALEAYCMYRTEFYKHLVDVESVEEYIKEAAVVKAVEDGIDIFHPVIGDANLRIYKQLGSIPENEFGESIEVFWDFTYSTFGNSVWGVNNASKYETYVKERGNGPRNKIISIGEALTKDKAIDESAPNINRTNEILAFPENSKGKDIKWINYITASDNVDGDYEFKMEKGKVLLRGGTDVKMAEDEALDEGRLPDEVPFEKGRVEIDYSGVDFTTVGEYPEALIIRITDKAGNTREAKYTVYIYDKDNTVAPKLEIKEGDLKTVELNALTEDINWGNDYIESATDVNGIDLKNRVSADVSYLDVTTEGEYPVTLYVDDFAGNRTEIEVMIKVKKS